MRESGILSPASSWPSPSGVSWRNFSPSRLSTSTEARLFVPNSTPLSTSKVTITFGPSSVDLLHPPHPDAADLHDVAAPDAARVAELRLVGRAPEAGELTEVERGGHDQHGEHDGDGARAHHPAPGDSDRHQPFPPLFVHRSASERKSMSVRALMIGWRPGTCWSSLGERDLPGEPADVVVVPRPVGAGAGLIGHRLRAAGRRSRRSARGSSGRSAAWPARAARRCRASAAGDPPAAGRRARRRGRRCCRGSRRSSSRSRARSVIQPSSSVMSWPSWRRRPSTVSSVVPRLVTTWPMSWSRSASASVSDAVCCEQAADRAALALQHLHEVHAQLVDLVGLQRLEERLEAVEEHGEVERGPGLLDRDHVVLAEPLGLRVGARLQRHVAVADEVEEADLGLGGARDGTSASTLKVMIAWLRS